MQEVTLSDYFYGNKSEKLIYFKIAYLTNSANIVFLFLQVVHPQLRPIIYAGTAAYTDLYIRRIVDVGVVAAEIHPRIYIGNRRSIPKGNFFIDKAIEGGKCLDH